MRRRPICVLCLILMASIWAADSMGLSLFRQRPLTSQEEELAEGRQVTVQGSLEEKTETETSNSIYLKRTILIIQSRKIPIENLKIYMEAPVDFPLGTRLEVRGKFRLIEGPRNPGEFDSKIYYETQGIFYTMSEGQVLRYSRDGSRFREAMGNLKGSLVQVLRETAKEQAPIFQAMLLGDKGDLDSGLKNQYQMAGMIHILAISGLHLSILGTGLYQLLKRLGAGNGLAGFLALSLMIPYGAFTGGSVATMRAVVMFFIGIGAKMAGRCYDLLTSLAAAAILILLEQPACLYYSGFQLSFGAVLGLGWILPVLEKTFEGSRAAKPFLGAVSVHLVMIPLLLYFFSEVSILGILLNLLVIPTMSAVLLSGLAGAAAGIWQTALGEVLIIPGRVLLGVYNGLAAASCRLPFCTWVGGRPQLWQMAVYYLGLILLVEAIRRKDWKKRGIAAAAAMICLYAILTGQLALKDRSGLRITCLDVGQGDCIVWEKEGKACWLMDGGSTSKSQTGMYQILPYVKSRGISRIQAAFVTHTDEDHCNGIVEILEAQAAHLTSVRIEKLILPDWNHKTEAFEHLEKTAAQAGVPVGYVKRGDVLRSGKMELSFLKPEQENDPEDVNGGSMAVCLEYGGFLGIFTGDIGEEQEKEIAGEVPSCTFLKVAHHGSKNSSCEEFLKKARPKISVISVAESNRYGHPHPDAVERLKKWSDVLLMTKDEGAVSLQTDGERVRVRSSLGKNH